VIFHQPKQGEKAELIGMANSNAKLLINEKILELMKAEGDRIPHSVKQLQKDLRLKRLPRRIECFDNSNLQGSDPVASMVCFVDGQPRKSEYKRFKIRTVVGPDDFASMKEILTRRYSRLIREGGQIPDLIIVDGGKGQLSSAVEALKDIEFFGQCDLVGLAKRLEEVFIPGYSDSIMIPKTSSSLKLIQRARDEAHRFAITFHRSQRQKRTLHTELMQIKGVGEKTALKLLKEIGSLKKIKQATESDLTAVVGPKLAAEITAFYLSGSTNAE
jgi:excinuclease ABC subunit C